MGSSRGTAIAAASVSLLVVALAGLALASAARDYSFERPPWAIDFQHAGNPEADATFLEFMGPGVCVLDYDADGWEDLFFPNARHADPAEQAANDPRSALYRNLAGAGFARVPGAMNVSTWGLGCAAGDYDRDGDEDLAMTTWGGPLLFRNDGSGAFANVSDAAGVYAPLCGASPCFGSSVAFVDYDLDADLDLYALNYVAWVPGVASQPGAYGGQCNRLLANDGDGTFTDVTDASGAADCGSNHLGLAIADVDGNRYPDFFLASDGTNDTLLLNEGNGRFSDVTVAAGVGDPRGGMGTAWGDYSGDGRLDLVITHYERERAALYRQGDGLAFEDRALADGIAITDDDVGWGVEILDFDHDADLDLLVVNGHTDVKTGSGLAPGMQRRYEQPSRAFENVGGRFVETSNGTFLGGVPWSVGRGLAVADFDRDGWLDAVSTSNVNESVHVRRSTGGPNNWLGLRLEGNATIAPRGLGAKVTVELPDGRAVTREVVAASSYLSQSTRDLRFGLGGAARAERVTIEWPDGTRETLPATHANTLLAKRAGEPATTLLALPVATARASTTTVARGEDVAFTGRVERTLAATASAEWEIAGERVAGASATRAFADLGEHRAVFRVVDAEGRAEEADVVVRVENLAPRAAFDAPATADRVAPLPLDARGSTDADGAIVSWAWRVEGETYEGATASHRFATLGEHEVALTVVDDEGAAATATRRVLVSNLPPVARAGRDETTSAAVAVEFDARASGDADGSIARYLWEFGDGVSMEGAVVRHRFPGAGEFVATLTVTDDDGASASDARAVTLSDAYPRPALEAPDVADRARDATFDARASVDLDGEIVRFEWEFGESGARAEGALVSHRFARLGVHTVRLTVTDDDGQRATLARDVAVRNLAPAVAAGAPVASEGLGAVAFDASGVDADGRIVAWRWDFGDGASQAGASATHRYARYGRFVATATATDDEGAAGRAERAVWIYARPVAAPLADASTDRVSDVAFDAWASSDADGSIVRYHWQFGDGATAEGPIVAHRYARLGSFVATLTVTDDDGWSASSRARVTVVNLPPEPAIDGFALANVGQRLAWTGAGSRDPDGAILRAWWEADGALLAEGERLEHAFATTGAHALTLVVEDSDGARASRTQGVEVVDRLDVAILLAKESWGPAERPRGVAIVRFANGLPAEGADVTVVVTWRGPLGVELHAGRARGVADAGGAFAFEIEGAYACPPIAVGGARASARAEARWASNAGAGEAQFSIALVGRR